MSRKARSFTLYLLFFALDDHAVEGVLDLGTLWRHLLEAQDELDFYCHGRLASM